MPTFFKPDTSSYPGIRWPSTAVFDAVGVELTKEDIRSLNTNPITIVPGEDNVFLAPGQVVFAGAQGSQAYSSALDIVLQYSDGSLFASITDTTWDGSASKLAVTPDALAVSSSSAADWTSSIGLALQLTSAGDVTDGDAPCTIIVFFTRYNLAGRL